MKRKFVVLKVLVVMVLVLLAGAVYSMDTDMQPMAFQYLTTARSSIDNLGGGNLRLYGVTEASISVTKIEVRLTLQRWNGSSWSNVQTYSAVNYNSTKVDLMKSVNVPAGTYRLMGNHIVYHDINESTITYTSSTTVN